MSTSILPWIVCSDEKLLVEWFCSDEGDTHLFKVDDVNPSSTCLVAAAMTCTHCGALDLMSRPFLQLPPPSYAIYKVHWQAVSGIATKDGPHPYSMQVVANSWLAAGQQAQQSRQHLVTRKNLRCMVNGLYDVTIETNSTD